MQSLVPDSLKGCSLAEELIIFHWRWWIFLVLSTLPALAQKKTKKYTCLLFNAIIFPASWHCGFLIFHRSHICKNVHYSLWRIVLVILNCGGRNLSILSMTPGTNRNYFWRKLSSMFVYNLVYVLKKTFSTKKSLKDCILIMALKAFLNTWPKVKNMWSIVGRKYPDFCALTHTLSIFIGCWWKAFEIFRFLSSL